MQHRHWIWLAALAACNAAAQSAARPDPADPAARVQETAYRSAFDGYQKHELSKQIAWREANDDVSRIGGHVGILREQAPREKKLPAADARTKDAEGKGTPASPGASNPPGARQ